MAMLMGMLSHQTGAVVRVVTGGEEGMRRAPEGDAVEVVEVAAQLECGHEASAARRKARRDRDDKPP